MPTNDEQHERLIRIDERTLATAESVKSIEARLETLNSHDREIALLKQAQESERKYQALKNSGFEDRLDEQAKNWADNESEHAGMMEAIKSINRTLSEGRGAGKVIYWLLGVVTTIAVALLIAFLTR